MQDEKQFIIETEIANIQAAIGGLEMVAERPELGGRTAGAMHVLLAALNDSADRIERAIDA